MVGGIQYVEPGPIGGEEGGACHTVISKRPLPLVAAWKSLKLFEIGPTIL